MQKIIKQTVYLPVNEHYEYSLAYWDKRDKSYQIEKNKNGEDISLKEQEGYFFTPEQLNEYTANVIKQALETAAENAYIDNNHTQGCAMESDDFEVDKESITNTFEETFKKFEK